MRIILAVLAALVLLACGSGYRPETTVSANGLDARIDAVEKSIADLRAETAPVDTTAIATLLDIHKRWTGVIIGVDSGAVAWDQSVDDVIVSIMAAHEDLAALWRQVMDGVMPVSGFELFMLLYLWEALENYVDPPAPTPFARPPGVG